MTKRPSTLIAMLGASTFLMAASCSIDRERKMYPGGGAPGGTVGTSGTVGGDNNGGNGNSGGTDLGSPDDNPPPNTDLGGAASLIDMNPPILDRDLTPPASTQRDLGPEFLELTDLGF